MAENQGSNPYQAPQAQVADVANGAGGVKMSPKDLFLSFQGRIPRKAFWIYTLMLYIPIIVIIGIAGAINDTLMMVVAVPLYIAMVWGGLALQVKRWHDRNKSGWWVLIALVPFIGSIWAFVEAGCLRGTVGGNNFGGDATGMY